ncbi:MAG TPA: hypothetical protein VFK05_13910 [Polyangiaceae bacterium]|nr:hypothetical protein [Polyangiaceae bacterium]
MTSLVGRSRQGVLWLSIVAIGTVKLLAACSDDSLSGSSAAAGSSGTAGSSGVANGPGGTSGRMGAEPPPAGEAGSAGSGEGGEGGEGGEVEPEPSEAGKSGSAGHSAGGTGGDASAGGESLGGSGDGGTGGAPSAQCTGSVLLAQTPKASGLALADGHVYWTTRDMAGQVLRAPITGGASEVIADNELYPYEVAANGAQVFWVALGTEVGHVFQASVTGAYRQELGTGDFSGVYSLSADADYVYYITNLNDVVRVPVGGGDLLKLSLGPYNSVIVDMVLDGPNLFWTNQGIGTFVTNEPESAGVLGVAVSGATAATPLVNRLGYPQFQVASDATSVFWNDDKAIYRTPKLGGTSTSVLSLPAAPLANSPIIDLLSDGTYLFYTDGHSVFRKPLLAGDAQVMTQGFSRIEKLAQDSDGVYFTDYVSGAVVKLAKCASALAPSDLGVVPPSPPSSSPAPSPRPSPTEVACDPATAVHGCPEAVVVATASHPYGLATDESYLYFSTLDTAGTIQKVPLAGGTPVTIASNEPSPHDLAVDANNVYWCLNDKPAGHLIKATKSGSDRKLLATGSGSGVGRVTSDGKFAYYVSSYNSLLRVAVEGGETAYLANGPFNSNVSDLTVRDGDVFWVNDGIFNANFSGKLPKTAYFARAPNTGSANLGRTTLQADLDSPLQRITSDAKYVYYIDATSVYRADLSGGAPTKLAAIAPASGTIVDLLSDGENLYFLDLKAVYRLPINGGSVETLSSGWGSLRSVAVDASNVYFTDYAGGAVLKRPK